MSILQIQLFGGVRVTHNDWLTEISITREIQTLLAYLLLQRHRVHSREVLAYIFWGEHSQRRARGSLNTALWKLKKVLEPAGIPTGTYLKSTSVGGVGFNQESEYWLDIEFFENEVNRIMIFPFQRVRETDLVDLEKVLDLYKGDLLEGCYKDWALRERERLRSLYVKSLTYLLHYYGFQGVYEKAITYGQQILELDPLREEIHRELMGLYSENEQRALAVRQYEICHSILDKELGISPMEDTQELYIKIVEGERNHLSMTSKGQIGVDQAIQRLEQAGQTVALAKEQIQQALHLIAKYLEHHV